MEEAITTLKLCKKFKDKLAVNNLDMHVPKGAIYGFIGRNGAGKSTAQKLICGLLLPTSGEIKLNGKPHTDRAERAKIGVLIENPGCFPSWSAYDNLLIQADNIGLKNARDTVTKALRDVGLDDVGKKHVGKFSLGMKQRLGIAAALLGNPELLILDEPINGLDPQGIMDMRNVIIDLNREKGTTVLISSHILGELSKMATHYGIIKDGTMVKEISADDLSRESKDYLNVACDDPQKAFAVITEKLHLNVEIIGNELHILDFKDGGAINKLLSQNGVVVSEMKFLQLDLEEYFMKLTGGAL